MTGIHPGAELTAEFEQRVLGVDPDLPFLDYSGESYDAAVLVALAASMAGSTDAQDFKDVVNGLLLRRRAVRRLRVLPGRC